MQNERILFAFGNRICPLCMWRWQRFGQCNSYTQQFRWGNQGAQLFGRILHTRVSLYSSCFFHIDALHFLNVSEGAKRTTVVSTKPTHLVRRGVLPISVDDTILNQATFAERDKTNIHKLYFNIMNTGRIFVSLNVLIFIFVVLFVCVCADVRPASVSCRFLRSWQNRWMPLTICD